MLFVDLLEESGIISDAAGSGFKASEVKSIGRSTSDKIDNENNHPNTTKRRLIEATPGDNSFFVDGYKLVKHRFDDKNGITYYRCAHFRAPYNCPARAQKSPGGTVTKGGFKGRIAPPEHVCPRHGMTIATAAHGDIIDITHDLKRRVEENVFSDATKPAVNVAKEIIEWADEEYQGDKNEY